MLSDAILLFMLFVALVRDIRSKTMLLSKGVGWAGLLLSAGTLYLVVRLQIVINMGVRSGVFATMVIVVCAAVGTTAGCFFYKGGGRWLFRCAAVFNCFLLALARSMTPPGAMW